MSWLLLALLSAFTAALVAIFGKVGVAHIDTGVATMLRAGIMFLLLFLFVAAMGKLGELRTISGKALYYIILSGIAGAASWLLYFWALKNGPASRVVPIDRLSLVFTVILAALFLQEKIGWQTAVGALVMIAGSLLIALA